LKFQSINFTCNSCGAPLRYSPTTASLQCEFCSTTQVINHSNKRIEEYDFKSALNFLDKNSSQEINKNITCNKCAASFQLTPYSISSNCPYCNTPAITNFIKEITPKSLLPFELTHDKAREKFKKWIGSLWFAPSKLKDYIEGNENLQGYYLPHWTYDSDTQTYYQGQKGVIYYVMVERTVIIEGRQRRVKQREARINWSPVRGTVHKSFDDITIGASKTISHSILNNLTPWDTTELIPFDERYLAGFEAEEYTIGLDNAFEYAKMKMSHIIQNDIRRDIGGDKQRIDTMQTTYSHTTYKNVLFPIWTAQFRWKEKEYNYAINAQTGKIVGKRPYSTLKITLLVIFILLVLGGIFYLQERYSNKTNINYPSIIFNTSSIRL